MNTPKFVFRIIKPVTKTFATGHWWNRNVVEKIIGYERFLNNEGKDNFQFFPEQRENLINYFTYNPPKVGDVIYSDTSYVVGRTFYNVNHDHIEIWLILKIGWIDSPVLLKEPLHEHL